MLHLQGVNVGKVRPHYTASHPHRGYRRDSLRYHISLYRTRFSGAFRMATYAEGQNLNLYHFRFRQQRISASQSTSVYLISSTQELHSLAEPFANNAAVCTVRPGHAWPAVGVPGTLANPHHSSKIMQRVEPLLCNDCEMGGYTRATSGQRLSKHVPAATDANAKIGELCFLCGPCRDVISKGQGWNLVNCQLKIGSVRECVKRGLERVKLKKLHC
jgi:hypothetical protein